MTQTAGWAYRLTYVAVLVLFGTKVVPPEVTWRAAAVAVYPASFLALLSLVLLTGITRRPFCRSTWVITVIWCLAFGWYAWLSGSSPFVPHELHTFEAEAAAVEVRKYYLVSISLFVLLILWFLTFPVVHRFESTALLGRDQSAAQ